MLGMFLFFFFLPPGADVRRVIRGPMTIKEWIKGISAYHMQKDLQWQASYIFFYPVNRLV